MSLLLPRNVAVEIEKRKWVEQRAWYRAKLEALFDFDDPTCNDWNGELRKLDPLLRMGRAKPMAYEPGFSVRPGLFHIVRENESAPPTVQPITGPDGESFSEPSSQVLESLRRNDLQNPRVYGALIAQHELRERAEEQQLVADRDERQTEMLEHWAAVSRTQVSMNTDTPWAQNHAGYSKVRGAKKG